MGKSRKTQTRKTSSGCAIKLKSGSILNDTATGQWQLGKPIGAGGFGDIYLVSPDLHKPVASDAPYVAKVELLSNGPLFVEMNFYLRVGKKDLIEKWKNLHELSHLGMPRYIAFGSHSAKNERFRFLILDQYGSDIGSIFLKHGRRFSLKTVLTLGLQILDILEYIHYYGYIHADVKGSNLLLGLGKNGENQVYLLDYGLACLYVDRYGRHKEYSQDRRRAHDGTLEYTSRDAHSGAHSRRGDIEVLGYNLLQWLCGELPWESDLSDPDRVAAAKNLYMGNISHFMDKCFPRGGAPVVIQQFMKYVAGLGFTARPDYEKLRSMLRQGLRVAGLSDDGLLNLGAPPSKLSAKKRGRGSDTENRRVGKSAIQCDARRSTRKPCTPVEVCDRRTRQRSMVNRTTNLRSQRFDWVKILQSHPEKDAKPLVKQTSKKTRRAPRRILDEVDPSLFRPLEDPKLNPTPNMLEIMEKRQSIVKSGQPGRRGRSDSRRSPSPCVAAVLTPAMEEVLRRRMIGSSGTAEPTTAMSARAHRMRLRERQIKAKVDPEAPIASRTRTRGSRPFVSPVRGASPESSNDSRSPSPKPFKNSSNVSEVHNTRTKRHSQPEPPPENEVSESLQPVVARLTRQQLRCDPSFWQPITGVPWRPPTPPKRKISKKTPPATPLSSNSSVNEDTPTFYSCLSSPPIGVKPSTLTSAARVARLSKTSGKLPTSPKYKQKALNGTRKRMYRREVSPSEIDFVPRLRSGRDLTDDLFYPRPASTPPVGLRCFAGNQSLSSRRCSRTYYNLACR